MNDASVSGAAGVRRLNLTGPAPCQLFEEVDQPLAARRVKQFAQPLHLDLTNAFARDPESLAHLFPRPLTAVDETEAELQHPTFARSQRVEDVLNFAAQQGQ